MGEFVGKLTNLSYEFFGVLLPGVIVHLFMLIVWAAMGATAPVITYGWLPQLRIGDLVSLVDSMTTERGVGAAILLLIGWYFLGQLTLWLSRSQERMTSSASKGLQHTWLTLRFRTPRPSQSYDPALEDVYRLVRAHFEPKGGPQFEWRQFYPIAKNFLHQNVAYSLVTTYQHKYTLHRSIACAAALLFWSLLAVAMLGLLGLGQATPKPSWHLIILGSAGAVVLAWGFSGSYRSNWLMFGNTIITECYALLNLPRLGREQEKPSRN
jgi:hypothetical protein